jgi:hypothetical protein
MSSITLAELDVDRFRVAGFDERVEAHHSEPYSASHGGATV